MIIIRHIEDQNMCLELIFSVGYKSGLDDPKNCIYL